MKNKIKNKEEHLTGKQTTAIVQCLNGNDI